MSLIKSIGGKNVNFDFNKEFLNKIPRIGILGLNPHCESILDYNEDEKIIIMSLSGVKQYPMRVKCATLAWHTLESAIKGKKEEVNTEVVN